MPGTVLKVVFPCRRRPDLDRAEYARRVLEGHVPLALKHHPGMRRYAVNIVEREPPEGPPADSFGILWFDDLESYRRDLYDSEEGRRIVGQDVAGFLGGAHAYGTREHVHRDELGSPVFGQRTPGLKWILCLKRRPELDRDAFLAHWHEVHVPLVLERLPTLRRYVTSAVEHHLSEDGEPWDGFAELWWDDVESARRALAEAGSAIDADTRRFIATVRAYTVAEYPQK